MQKSNHYVLKSEGRIDKIRNILTIDPYIEPITIVSCTICCETGIRHTVACCDVYSVRFSSWCISAWHIVDKMAARIKRKCSRLRVCCDIDNYGKITCVGEITFLELWEVRGPVAFLF